MIKRELLLVLLIGFYFSGLSQTQSGYRTKVLLINSDTIVVDSLSIVPYSEIVKVNGAIVNDSLYSLSYWNSLFIDKGNLLGTNIEISYRTFAIDFSQKYFHKNKSEVQRPEFLRDNSSSYRRPAKVSTDYFSNDRLDKRGNVSRGISFGNKQDVIVNSSLNLQLSGRLSSEFQIQAAITDDNIPIQPNGNSQQIQDFDKVFIRVFNSKTNIIVGDIRLSDKRGKFLKLDKNIQGASFSTIFLPEKKSESKFKTSLTAAISKGKYNRMNFMGIEGNQGPYKLFGADNESYIIVIAGSEKVFVDGVLIKRGEDNDYTIDYNLAELSFTSQVPVTKDKRITIEFEYSERNYTRYLLFNSNEFITKNSSFYINVYSESDSKNQPLMQNLNDSQKQFLSNIGDSVDLANVPNIDSIQYSGDLVLYKKTDTIVNGQVYFPIYIWSANPDSAFYKLGFTYVGLGNGNYETFQGGANGKVYKWVSPNAENSLAGSYEPVILLVTPKKKQMLSIGGEHKIGKNSKFQFDISLSNTDVNMFSDLHAGDNIGFALDLGVSNSFDINYKKIQGSSSINYYFISKDFSAVENFRNIEFYRDWNIEKGLYSSGEHYVKANINLHKDSVGTSSFTSEYLSFSSISKALKNEYKLSVATKDYDLDILTSYMFSEDNINETGFFRNRFNIAKHFNSFILGATEETEYNRWRTLNSDSLASVGGAFNRGEFYISNPDSSDNKYKIAYSIRQDLLPNDGGFIYSSLGQDLNLSYRYRSKKRQSYKAVFSYRNLYIPDTTLLENKQDQSINSRFEFNNRWLNGGVTSSMFYEIGSGLEQKKEYSFIQVSSGQGIYIWNDYNDDDIQQLNEFEISSFQDTANYIRIFIPGNEYEKILSNRINQSLFINPSKIWKKKNGLVKVLARFTNRTIFMADRKNSPDMFWANANPYSISSNNSVLRNLNSSFRNILTFNKRNPGFGLDYIIQNTKNKILLVNGFDSGSLLYHSLIARFKISQRINLKNQFDIGEKIFSSDFFEIKNYEISYYKNSIIATWAPVIDWRVSLNYDYSDKKNQLGDEVFYEHVFGTHIIYKLLSKGNLDLKINYIQINYNTETIGSPVAYEMLGGFQPGRNLSVELRFQSRISENLQLNLSYSGRDSENSKMFHTGGIQLRAFF